MTATPGAGTVRRRPARPPARPGGRVSARPGAAGRMGSRPAARAAADAAAAATRSSSSRTASRTSTSDGPDGVVVRRPGQRTGDGGRAGDARLLGHLDRARQRRRRPRGRRRARPRGRAARAATNTSLRRIWLSAEEEQGYYYGFANEGMWPLCHVAHVRPVFRESDWEHYRDGQPALRRCRRRRGAQRGSDRAGAGLPLRAGAGDDPRQAAAGDDPDLLAHPLAEPGILRHLPVAARDPARACSAARSSAFTRASTARTSSRRSIASSRRASSTSTRPSPSRARRR